MKHQQHQHDMTKVKRHENLHSIDGNASGHHCTNHQHISDGGHDHNAMINDFRKRFYVMLVLTVPVLLLSPMMQHWLHWQLTFSGSSYVLFLLSTVIFIYGESPFLTGWLSEMKAKNPGMMTLIGFAITVAYGYSAAIVFGLTGMDFFWEIATLILIMLLGHWTEMRSVAGTSRKLELLVQLMPSDAHLVHGEHLMEEKTDSLKEHDLFLIKPGKK